MKLLTHRCTHTVASALTVVAQRIPFIKDFGLILQSTSNLLRWAAPVGIQAIGTHSLSGASTTIKPAAGSTNPTSGVEGEPITSWIFRASPEKAEDYTVSGLPPGVTFTFDKNASGGYQFLEGTPTATGSFHVVITAYRYVNHSGGSEARTTYNLTMNIEAAANPLAISSHPTGGTYPAGANITLEVVATGSSLSYQWKRGSETLSGEQAASLTINGFSAASAGSYTVEVSDGSSTLTSDPAVLALQEPYETWQGQQGWSPAELADPGISGPDANPDLDRMANILEFCLDLDPNHPDAQPGSVVDDPSSPETHYLYALPLNPDASGVGIVFQINSSLDPDAWTPVGESDPDFPVTRTEDSISIRIPKSLGRRFIRLSASL